MATTIQQYGWLKFFFWFGPILLFGGGLFLLDGAWQTLQNHYQRSRWTAAQARVQACSIYESWQHVGTPGTKNTLAKISYVRCRLWYRAGDSDRESAVKVGDSFITYGEHRLFLSNLTLARMQDWIARHPSGSLLAIHYDPSNPATVSLVGADSELKQATPYDRLRFGILTCISGLAIIALGRLSRRRREVPAS